MFYGTLPKMCHHTDLIGWGKFPLEVILQGNLWWHCDMWTVFLG